MKKMNIISALMALFFLLPCASYANYSVPGKYLKVHRSRICAVSYGKGPAVIFESGLGDGIDSWSKVAPTIAKHAHIVLYDRAGIEKSSIYNKTLKMRTAQMAVNNLVILLKMLKVSPPYILVGHSLGGLYMQLFAREFPNEVCGVVLIDSASPYQTAHDPLPDKKAYYYPEALGIPESEAEVRRAPRFPNVPLVVVSATIHGEFKGPYNNEAHKKEWAKLQAQLASLSSKSTHITANRTGHYIQKEKPWLVIAAVNHVINLCKESAFKEGAMPGKGKKAENN